MREGIEWRRYRHVAPTIRRADQLARITAARAQIEAAGIRILNHSTSRKAVWLKARHLVIAGPDLSAELWENVLCEILWHEPEPETAQ